MLSVGTRWPGKCFQTESREVCHAALVLFHGLYFTTIFLACKAAGVFFLGGGFHFLVPPSLLHLFPGPTLLPSVFSLPYTFYHPHCFLVFVFSPSIGPFLVSWNLHSLSPHTGVNLYKLELKSAFMSEHRLYLYFWGFVASQCKFSSSTHFLENCIISFFLRLNNSFMYVYHIFITRSHLLMDLWVDNFSLVLGIKQQ